MSSSRDTSREEQAPAVIALTKVVLENCLPREYRLSDGRLVMLEHRLAALDYVADEVSQLRAAFHHACAEVARWRAWYGFADFGLTEAPDEQVQDVQQEFLVKARGVGA